MMQPRFLKHLLSMKGIKNYTYLERKEKKRKETISTVVNLLIVILDFKIQSQLALSYTW
jgi:hypothetical protein